MAKITRKEVEHLADLAKIKLREDEIKRMVNELSRIVGYVEQIDVADVSGLKSTDRVTGLSNIMRPDEIRDYGETTGSLLKNAPATEKNYIKVKRVLS